MNKFGERFKELRLQKKLTQSQIGKEFNVSKFAISCWELGKQETSFDMLIIISKFFDVSTDYLLGLKDF